MENSIDINCQENLETYHKIITHLESLNITFKTLSHAPTYTSEESATARGEDLSIGGKAIVLKMDNSYNLFVLSASKQINTKSLKAEIKAKKVRFATVEELKNLTGLVPGSVPPFGKPILPFNLYIDESVMKNEKIAFNAGSLTHSIVMNTEDYLKASNGKIFSFSS